MIGEKVHIGRKLRKLEESIRKSIDCEEDSIKLVTIPKAAKHASRHHCSLKLHESNELGKYKLDLQVFGQNGMQLQGVKIPQGQKELQVTNGDIISLGFFTEFEVKVVCQAHVTASAREEQEESTLPLVPTSEATLGLDLDLDSEHEDGEKKIEPEQAEENVDEEEEGEEEEEEQQVDIKSMSRKSSSSHASIASSPASVSAKRRQDSRESSHQPVKRLRLSSEVRSSPAPSPYAHQDDDGYPPEDSSESEDEAEIERRKEGMSSEHLNSIRNTLMLSCVPLEQLNYKKHILA